MSLTQTIDGEASQKAATICDTPYWEKLAKDRGEENVSLRLQVQDLIETRGDLERQLQSPKGAWKIYEAPKGKPIVAVGRVIQSDEISTVAIPFVAAIVWMKDESGYEGWHYCHDRMTVARTLEEEVMIDYWTEYPTSKSV